MEFCCFFFNLHPYDLYCRPEFGVETQKTKDTVSKDDGRDFEGLGCIVSCVCRFMFDSIFLITLVIKDSKEKISLCTYLLLS